MYGLYQIVYFAIIDITNTLKSPFFILVLGIICFQYMRIGKIEKENIGYKRSITFKIITSSFFGILGGIMATVIFLYQNVAIVASDFMYILVFSMALSIIDSRFVCFSYGGSILSIISLIIDYPIIAVKQVISVIAILHIIESILILFDGATSKNPGLYEVDNEIVGGFNMTRFWPIPFVIFVGDAMIQPIPLMAMVGYGDYSICSYPKKKVKKTASTLFLYGIILLYINNRFSNRFIAPIFALVVHELIMMRNKNKEIKGNPIYMNERKGLKIIEVLPGTIGRKLNIKSGDIILKINGVEVNSTRDLDHIMNTRFSPLRVEYFNIKRGLTIRKYTGKRKSLGLIVVPRDF